ncbi:MAG: hypothetical protein Q8784_00815 [Vigna little leaf phytoplasma]|nr:hypothetical protein [Vigna little leaf phytoplasma]
MMYKNKNEQSINPIFEVIKQEYGWINFVIIFFSMLLIGLFRTLREIDCNNRTLYLILSIGMLGMLIFFFGSLCVLVIKIFQGFILIKWPSLKTVFYYMLQVIFFTFFLVMIVNQFNVLYDLAVNYTKKL